MDVFRLIGRIAIENDSANAEIDKTVNKAEKSGSKLKGNLGKIGAVAGKMALGVAGAAVAVGGALVAMAESTREYRTEMGKLETAFTSAGHSSEVATETYKSLQMVLGDTGQAVEASNHLAKLCNSEEELATWTDICTGVYATFGASLPIESLTEAANETAKTGQLTGSLADALNWAGINEEQFQAQLDACTNETERQQLITQTLNDTYKETADRYKEVNADILASQAANERLTAATAKVGAAVEPVITVAKNGFATLLESIVPVVETVAEHLPAAIEFVSGVYDTYFKPIIDGVVDAVEWLMTVPEKIKGVADTIGSALGIGEESRAQEKKTATTSASRAKSSVYNTGDSTRSGSMTNSTTNYNFTFNSPKALSAAEANKQSKRAYRDFALGF